MWVICDFNVFFPIYGQFAAIWKLDSGRLVNKTYIFINNNLLLTKTENGTKSFFHSSHTIILTKGTIFAKKC